MSQVKYDVKIHRPFRLTKDDKQLIKDYKPVISTDWIKPVFSELKGRIRRRMSVQQNDFCPYCGTKIEYGGYGEPLEHIIDKGRYPEWMFEPKNLVLSCYPCNTKKSTKNVMLTGCYSIAEYPDNSGCIRVIHPHFDVYLEHIEIVDEIFVRALNMDKGWNTIEVFGLLRLSLPMKKAHALSIGTSTLSKATEGLKNTSSEPYLIQQYQDLISDLISRYQESLDEEE